MTGFFPQRDESKKRKSNPPSTFDVEQATALAKTLKRKKLIDDRIKLSAWSIEFKQLRFAIKRDNQDPHELIPRVLDWYLKNINREFVPVCHNAKAFRLRFKAIQKAIERVGDNLTPISAKAKKLHDEIIRHYYWSGHAQSQLLVTIQKSIEEYTEIVRRFKIVRSELEKENWDRSPLRRFGDHLATGYFFSGVNNFIPAWMENVSNFLKSRRMWNGVLSSYALKLDSTEFQRMGRQISAEYYGSSELWDQLVERMQNAD